MNHLRRFDDTDRDYGRLVEIHNVVWPEWSETVESIRAEDALRSRDFFRQRYVWEENGEIVAYASIGESPWSYEPGKYFVFIVVHPDWQGRGIGRRLYGHVTAELDGREPRPRKLVSDTRENFARAIRFLEDRGFEQVQRQEVSRLDIERFDWGRFSERRGAAERAGLAVRTGDWLLENDTDAKRKLYDLVWSILEDVPTPDPLTRRPFDEWVREEMGHPAWLPEAWFVAIDGDDYVGVSSAWTDLSNSERLYQGLTGVLRPYRRRGLATDLKVRISEFARERGVRYIITDN
jgi:mycothiol synthase